MLQGGAIYHCFPFVITELLCGRILLLFADLCSTAVSTTKNDEKAG